VGGGIAGGIHEETQLSAPKPEILQIHPTHLSRDFESYFNFTALGNYVRLIKLNKAFDTIINKQIISYSFVTNAVYDQTTSPNASSRFTAFRQAQLQRRSLPTLFH
jgi:hypothetical protein